jgi:hypothetical protein
MVLFVLYAEPLLKMLDNEIEGLQMGHDATIRSMAYIDDI